MGVVLNKDKGFIQQIYLEVHKISEPNNPYMSVRDWIESNKATREYKYWDRRSCNSCDTEWEKNIDQNLFIAITNKGSKILCESCYKIIYENNLILNKEK